MFRAAIVKSKLTFFQKERERISIDPIILTQYSFGLIPKVLYAIDMVSTACKHERVINPLMRKQADIQSIVTAVTVRLYHAVRRYFTGYDRHQGLTFGV